MSVDWTAFTPWTSLTGGVVIGLAAALLLLVNGRVAGISGIVGGLLRPRAGEFGWRLAFMAGLLMAPLVYGLSRLSPRSLVATLSFMAAGFATVYVVRHMIGL